MSECSSAQKMDGCAPAIAVFLHCLVFKCCNGRDLFGVLLTETNFAGRDSTKGRAIATGQTEPIASAKSCPDWPTFGLCPFAGPVWH